MENKDHHKIKLIVGLGNPGENYKEAWHNAGFVFIDKLKDDLGQDNLLTNKKEYELVEYSSLNLKLLKPLTFMNRSGVVLAHFLKFNDLHPSEILIVHDDLDIQFGEFKLQTGKFPREHNGLLSIHKATGQTDYNYLRIGIETRTDEMRNRIPGEDYVLQKIPKNLMPQFEQTLKKAIERLYNTHMQKPILNNNNNNSNA